MLDRELFQNWVRPIRCCARLFVIGGCISACLTLSTRASHRLRPSFVVSFPGSVLHSPLTGRLLLMISRENEPEVRHQNSPCVFGVDVDQMRPGQKVVIDETIAGFPFHRLSDVPPGDYYVQALLNVYTQFHRADGHAIWAHMDQWEGQQFDLSPGNLFSEVRKIHLDSSNGYNIALNLTEVIPPLKLPPDTTWVKHIKIQSRFLSEFWGRPIYLGAVILLPRNYVSDVNKQYPVIYQQNHFSEDPPFGFTTEERPEKEEDRQVRLNLGLETGYEFYRAWNDDSFPRMIAVTFQHPTPYFDDSYAVNSVNNGPYGDAIMTELIPYIEEHFRIIRQPYARVLIGGSTGGWEALALQLFHPDFFGGAWVFYPDPIDFRRYGLLNIYEDVNAFTLPTTHSSELQLVEWIPPERYFLRRTDGQPLATIRQVTSQDAVLGSHGRSGDNLEAWEAVYGPVGEDGYPVPLWDKSTGVINHTVANYMRDHGYDLRYYAEQNWSKIGTALVGKLHFYCGDMDTFYLNLATYLFEEFAKQTKDPYYDGSFEYGRPMKGHGWHPVSNAGLVRIMARHVERHLPPGISSTWTQN